MDLLKNIAVLLLTISLFSACSIDSLSNLDGFENQIVSDQKLNAIQFVNDSVGYIAGGTRYLKGIVLETTDYGATWVSLPVEISKLCYDIDLSNQGQIFISVEGSKVLRSYNGTNNLQVLQYNTRPSWMPLHAVHFYENTHGMAVGGYGNEVGGLITTTNAFETFELDSFEVELRSVFLTDESTAYAAGYGVVMKTTDFGATWQYLNVEGDFFVDIDFPSENIGYVIGQEGSIVKTEDAGATWEQLRKGNNLTQQKHRFTAIYFEDNLVGYLVGENGLYWQTIDGGINWQQFELENKTNLNDIYSTNQAIYIVGDNGTIIKTKK